MIYTDPLIWTKNKVLSSEFCKHTINKFENDERKHEGLIGLERRTSSIKKSVDLNISYYLDWKDEDSIFYQSLKENIVEYIEYCNKYNNYFPNAYVSCSMRENRKDTGYQIQRTKPGEYYDWHNDGLVENNFSRIFTYIWYLNDISQEGYTEFSNGIKVQPEQGKILIFPSTWTYVHRGVSPKFETKYISIGWYSYELSA
jgi:Rps23 Pro-64 3,4-dihydroxylase Tpa1-like proline 4-hydroxylase